MSYNFDFKPILANFDLIIEGILFTGLVSLLAIVLGLALGILAASLMFERPRNLGILFRIYVELIRNTPLLVQVWLLYFGLVQVGVDLSAFTSGVLALGINTGAYAADVIYAGFLSIDKSVVDAALALGFSPISSYFRIKLPLAIRLVLPSLGNTIIQCLLASALLSVLGINELTNQTLRLSNRTFRSFEAFIIAGIIYIIFNLILTLVVELVKKKSFKGTLH